MATNSMRSVTGPERYSVRSVEDLLKIPDMKIARELLKEWHVDTRGIKSKDEAVKRLIDFWRKSEEHHEKKRKDNGFEQAIADYRTNKHILCDKYDEVNKYYMKLPGQHKDDLDRFFKGISETVTQRKQELTSSGCTILIAGETSSGKSSFINLLLETDLLPTSDLQCTSTICEIRHSKSGTKYAILHGRSVENQKQRPTPQKLDLNNSGGISALADVVTRIDEETEESPYSRVDIYWPIPSLGEEIVIVDTPGIGASHQLSKSVQRYLTKSFGFIYIVNSANAGGVQKGRLKDFLSLVTTSIDEDFNPRATLFVCNKWDTVPEADQEDVFRNTITQLKRCYPGVRQDQILRLSTSEAQKAMRYADSMTKEHEMVLNGLENLLPTSLKNQLSLHYGWISQVLKRSQYSLKVAKLMDAKGLAEKEEMQRKLTQQMDRLDKDAKYTLAGMRNVVNAEIDTLYDKICRLLSSTEVQSRLCYWQPDQCPPSDNWKKVVKESESRIATHIAMEINRWDDAMGIVKELKDKIVFRFKRDFQLMEDQMRDLESILLPGDARTVADFHKSMKRPAPAKNIFKKADKKGGTKTTDDLNRIGGAAAYAGSLNTKSKDVRSIFKSYKKGDPRKIMENATIIFIGSIMQGDVLKSKLNMFLGKYIKGIDDIGKMIPDLIKADRQLMETLHVEVRENKGNIAEIYPELIRESSKRQGLLDMYYIKNLMQFDFRVRDLDVDKSRSLGCGSFANVYFGHLKPPGEEETQVAVKINKLCITATNVSDVLLEDQTMRDLKHENIVKYFGSVLSMNEKSQISWIMVLEFCKCTLKDVVLEDDYENPGKLGERLKQQVSAMKEMSRYVTEICRGLQYIHSKDLVHRDLKLENVLISLDNRVRLTDVGLTKDEDLIAATMAGSPVYMAPEVLEAQDIYDHRADLYSLGIILWEMWYGNDAAEHIQLYLHGPLVDAIKTGLRPMLSLKHPPPDDWSTIIKRCWSGNPSSRIEAKVVGNFFENFIKSTK